MSKPFYSEIPMSLTNQVIKHHINRGTLEKVVETTYYGMPDMGNNALSVTYLGDSRVPSIVTVNDEIVLPTPMGDALMELYIKYSFECPVHQTVIVTRNTFYTATYIKGN